MVQSMRRAPPGTDCSFMTLRTRYHRSPMRRLIGAIAACFVLAAMLAAPAAADSMDHERPIDTPGLIAGSDPDLQRALETLVRKQGLWKQVQSRRLAIGVADITDLDAPHYAALNPDHMMYAASLPKIAILLGAFVKIAAGDLELDDALHDEMVRMIRYSDNAAATSVLAKVGRRDLIEILKSEPLRLYDADHNGGLWVGKDYGPGKAYRRDPLHNLSHGATVHQVIRYFYLLEKGELVDARYRDEMKEILSNPGISHKFVAGLKGRPGLEMFRKSGTWREFHADAALVEAGDHRFIIVGMARHRDGGKWLAALAGPMHDLVVRGAEGSSGARRLALSH